MAPPHSSTATEQCVFCRIVKGDLTPGVVAYQDSATAVFPSLHQRSQNCGHIIVIPVAHVRDIYSVERDLGGALMETVAAVARAVKKIASADGITIRQNNERHGGQSVFHLHFHVIPRFVDDGFDRGEDRFPFGLVKVPYEECIHHAELLRRELNG